MSNYSGMPNNGPSGLSDDEKLGLLERLKLAREMVGSVDALDHFLA